MEKHANNPSPCPFLPMPEEVMSFRDLKLGKDGGSDILFVVAGRYSQYLWIKGYPARAILALLRAVYLDPDGFSKPVTQPYRAYRWFLENHQGVGFIGNPRVSFTHQATRIPHWEILKKSRAWGMWYLTRQVLPNLPPDPASFENPPGVEDLQKLLNRIGHPSEGNQWVQAMHLSSK